MEDGGDDDVWRALANPLRRRVLDLLRDGPRTTGDLAAAFPDVSRFAVMQHLAVLEQSGLLLVRRQGRHRLNHLNAVPIQQIQERWVSSYASGPARRALALKRHLEDAPAPTPPITETTTVTTTVTTTDKAGATEMTQAEAATGRRAQAVRIESELRIDAPTERVFKALTVEQHDWYPYTYGGDRVRSIAFEERVGGSCYEDWGDGRGVHYGTITAFDPPHLFAMRGFLGGATVLENRFVLTDDGGSTVLAHTMTAFGDLSEDDLEGIRTHGTLKLFEPQLKAWAERGERVKRG